jgi:hypothetical protein
MGSIIQAIVLGVLRFTWGAITEWMRQRELEEAKRRAEFLEGVMNSKNEMTTSQAELQRLQQQLEEEHRHVETAKQKFDWIHKFNHPEETNDA